MILSLVAAAAENNVIGKDGKLPWSVPADLARFRDLTKGHPVIMGRKTYESIGRPLPDRDNVVVSRMVTSIPGCRVAESLADALLPYSRQNVEVFIIGGGEIYREVMEAPADPHALVQKAANRIYLTRIHGQFDGDAYFPSISEDEWRVVSTDRHEADEKNEYPYTFIQYERNTASR